MEHDEVADIASEKRQIALVAPAGRADRYADRYETSIGLVDVVPLHVVDYGRLALIVIDTPTPPEPQFWAEVAVPVLMSPDLLCLRGFIGSLPAHLDWAPLAPWPYGADVEAARSLTGGGRISPIRLGHVSTGTGIPAHPAWETEEWWACSNREAVFGGILLGETLVGARLTSTQVLARSSTMLLLKHIFDGGAVLTQTVAPSSATGLPWLSVTLVADNGRVGVNQEFAPGNVYVWEPAATEFTFPAVRLLKPNVQAADSVRGSWELVTLLASMLNNDRETRSGSRAAGTRIAERLRAVNP